MDILIGFFLGVLREFFVVSYYRTIQRRRAYRGSALTLAIGLLDLIVIAKMAWDKSILLAGGYVIGETVGTFLSIRMGK